MLKLAHVAGQCISPVVGQERGRIWSGAQRSFETFLGEHFYSGKYSYFVMQLGMHL